jgi:predicted transcriptional regulator of viral defense system
VRPGLPRDHLPRFGLEYWDLTDHIPREVHLAVARGAHRPRIDHPPTRIHVFQEPTFELGRLNLRAETGEQFWITDRERAVVDAFRLPVLVGEDAVLLALRRYLSARPDLARMGETAGALGTWSSLNGVRVMQG